MKNDLNIVSISILYLFFWMIDCFLSSFILLNQRHFFDEVLTNKMALIFYGFSSNLTLTTMKRFSFKWI